MTLGSRRDLCDLGTAWKCQRDAGTAKSCIRSDRKLQL